MNKYLTIAATLILGLGAASAQTAAPAAQVTNFTDVPAGHWAKDAVALIVDKGLIQGFPDGTFRGNENLTRYQAALIFARLLQNGGLSNGGLSAEQVATITKGMQDVSTELAAVSTRVSDLEKASADQQARIAALEGKIDSAASANVSDLTARVTALEAAVKAIPAPAPAVDLTDINNRLAALEARSTTTSSTTIVNPAPVAPTVVTVDTTSNNTGMGLYAGIDTTFGFGPNAKNASLSVGNKTTATGKLPFTSSFGATLGASNFIYGLGARVNVDYTPRFSSINADANLMYTFGAGSTLSPYAGLGFGATTGGYGNTTATATSKVTDMYVHGLLGADFRVAGNVGLFGEFDAKYYLSNKGYATTLDTTAAKGFVPAAKIGLKYFF